MVEEIARLTRCHKRTVEKWIQRRRIPDTPYELLDIVQNGRLGKIHKNWRGWTICNRTGILRSPSNEIVCQGDVQAIPYRRHLIAHLQRELQLAQQPEDAQQPLFQVDDLDAPQNYMRRAADLYITRMSASPNSGHSIWPKSGKSNGC